MQEVLGRWEMREKICVRRVCCVGGSWGVS